MGPHPPDERHTETLDAPALVRENALTANHHPRYTSRGILDNRDVSQVRRCLVSSGILLGMVSIFLPDSKGSGIKPGTVKRPTVVDDQPTDPGTLDRRQCGISVGHENPQVQSEVVAVPLCLEVLLITQKSHSATEHYT